MRATISHRFRQHVAASLRGEGPVVLAISGGVDSMALLDAAAATVPADRLRVATFDHGTGAAATRAADLVRERAAALGLRCTSARATAVLRGEAAFRAARWRFLRSVAGKYGARVATAHTADDQAETVLMRILRGAGARGIAGLYASGSVLRPLLELGRRDVLRYARARRLDWVDDPSNASLEFLRNRVRHELLPALRRVDPTWDRHLLDTARAAAAWRREVAACVDRAVDPRVFPDRTGADVPADALAGLAPEELRVLWPEIASRVGVALDRRGTERLAAFTGGSRVGARVQVSGGWEVIRSREAFQLRVSDRSPMAETSLDPSEATRWDRWSFTPAFAEATQNAWSAWLPRERPLVVRRWQPGDVMVVGENGRPRKVKYFLSDAGITGHERTRWPVVLAGDQIVWIPGVRRSAVATARPGRPALAFACEYLSR